MPKPKTQEELLAEAEALEQAYREAAEQDARFLADIGRLLTPEELAEAENAEDEMQLLLRAALDRRGNP